MILAIHNCTWSCQAHRPHHVGELDHRASEAREGEVGVDEVCLACPQQRVDEHLVNQVGETFWPLFVQVIDRLPYQLVAFYCRGSDEGDYMFAKVVLVLVLKSCLYSATILPTIFEPTLILRGSGSGSEPMVLVQNPSLQGQ